MKGKWTLVSVSLVALLLTVVGVGLSQIQGSEPPKAQPTGGIGLAAALGTGFTYQGQLKQGGNPVNVSCDFQFSLWDAVSGGSQIGSLQEKTNVAVTNGLFTVELDFGAGAFSGDARWLLIAVRCPAGSGSYTPLSPRQALTPAPYALALPGLYTQQNATSPNLIGGHVSNTVTAGVVGATIGGGGASGAPNRVTGNYGTVGGGYDNTASDVFATIGGGQHNIASSDYATIGGGKANIASGQWATVPGGKWNTAQGDFSVAAGYRAKAYHHGAFVWADSTEADFASTAVNQFAVRATGGVSFSVGSAPFLVNGNTVWHAGNDGAGSSLDADLLDGQHASAFAPSTHTHPDRLAVPVIFDDFDRSTLNLGLGWLPSPQWITYTSGLGYIFMSPDDGLVVMASGYGGAGKANISGNKRLSVLDGTLIFKANVLAYEDNNTAYGDGLPRGLVDRRDRSNAIEFINHTGSAVRARTVRGGVATETVYSIPGSYPENTVNTPRFYMIVATATEVKFYLDGVLIATHTTNIPTVPLNPYFGVSYDGFGNVPIGVDYVSFGIIR